MRSRLPAAREGARRSGVGPSEARREGEAEAVERRIKAIRQRIDRLDNAFLYEQSIDIDRYDRHKERLNEELTLARMDRHHTELEEMDVEGILGFAERVLPRAADLWVQASLEQRQRLQQLLFPERIAFDPKAFVRTALTAPAFNWLQPEQPSKTSLVAQIFTSWNPLTSWMRIVERLRHAG